MVAMAASGISGMAPRRRGPDSGPRDRIDLRAEPEWISRVEAAARRFGISLSAYIRLAVSERMERDAASQPPLPPKGKGR
jgi:hypothetical protein